MTVRQRRQVTLLDTETLVAEYREMPSYAEGGTDLAVKLKVSYCN